MKQFLAMAAIASFMISCNPSSADKAAGADSSMHMTMNADSMPPMSSGTKDGSMTMKHGKMMVMNTGKWEVMDHPVTCTDECKVLPDGEVIMKNGQKMMMKEGDVIDQEGHLIDANGKMMMGSDMMMNDSVKK